MEAILVLIAWSTLSFELVWNWKWEYEEIFWIELQYTEYAKAFPMFGCRADNRIGYQAKSLLNTQVKPQH